MSDTVARRWVPRAVWIAIGVSVALRLLYLLEIRHNPYFDSPIMDEGYHDQWARELASGQLTGQIPFFRAPLYPFFLSVFYLLPGEPHYALIRCVQLLIGAATPALVWAVMRRLVPDRPRAATIAAFVTACDGMLVHFEANLLLESLLAPISVLLVLMILRAGETGAPRRWLAAGLVLGLFAITRPNVLLVAPLVFVLALGWQGAEFALRRWRWRSALAATAGTCLLVLPITFVNWKVGGDRVLVATQGGVNFYFGNNPDSNGWGAGAPGFRGTWWGTVEDAKRLAEEAEGRPLRPSEVSDYWYGRGLAWWREHPGDALALTARKTVFLLSGLELPNNEDTGLFIREFAPPYVPFLYLLHLMTPLALIGAWWCWRRGGPGGRAVVVYMAIYAVTIVMFFVCDRYRVPLRPLLAMLAVQGGYIIHDSLRARRWRGALPAAAAVVLGLALNLNPWVMENRRSAPQFYDSAADMCRSKGRFAEAIYYERKLVAMVGEQNPAIQRDLALIYLEAGRPQEAIAPLERARRAVPRDPELLDLLANALVQAGQPNRADRAYEEAEAGGMDSAQILLGHAILLERIARPREVVQAMYAKVVAKDPRFAPGWSYYGTYEANAGHLEEAIRLWETALRLEPGNQGVQLSIARARQELAARPAPGP